MAVLCRRYEISRKTGYKWLERYRADGPLGLQARSRAPHGRPRAISAELAAMIVAVRKGNETWGPRKVRAYLKAHYPAIGWPAASTIGTLFDREDLTVPRLLRQRVPPRTSPLAHASGPNAVWTKDFKGWFRTGDGARCDPLTIQDAASRYLLRCQQLDSLDGSTVWRQIELCFQTFGMPERIRSDNGPPFASRAVGGLSWLSVQLIKAGVVPERIAPGKPQQNGRHERMHLTLKQDTASPPAASLAAQQRRFDRFQRIYNTERPHEALDDRTPASCYRRATRSYHGHLESPAYGDDRLVRRVRTRGEIKWHGRLIFISQVLTGEPVGLVEIDTDNWRVDYGPIELGIIDPKGCFKKPRLGT
jgi:transposase InsO family protein